MDKKLRELLAQLSKAKEEGRSYVEAGDEANAETKLNEVRSLEKQIEQHKAFIEDEKRSMTNKLNGGGATQVGKQDDEPEQRSAEDIENEYRSAFLNMVRGATLSGEEARSLKAGTAASGGYTVPKSFQKKLIDKLQQSNIMRQLAEVIQTDSDMDIPIVASHGTAAWTQEEQAFNESDDTFGLSLFARSS